MKKATLAILCAALFSAVALAQTPSWAQVTTANSPPGRGHLAAVYDSSRDVVVMFGGMNSIERADTWEFDGVDWTQVVTTPSPSARQGHAMVYDSVRGKLVLFGGYHGQLGPHYLNDTWEFDGVSWVQVVTANAPSGRESHGMAFDQARARVVVFSGSTFPNQGSDTWEFDGVDWTSVSTVHRPSTRNGHAMAYDAGRGKIVMFGGAPYQSETWEYDGLDWVQISTPTAPLARRELGMTYDVGRGKILLFGGYSNVAGFLGDTWEFDGTHWAQIFMANTPIPRQGPALTFDSQAGHAVVFGGRYYNGVSLYPNDTWEFTGGAPLLGAASTYGNGCGSPALALASTTSPVIGTVADAVIANAPTVLAGVSVGFSDTFLPGLPLPVLPFSLSGIGMTGCELLHSNDVFGLVAAPLTATTLRFELAIPYSQSLLQTHVYVQSYCYAPGANPLEIIASNGLDWTIGNQ